MQNEALFKCGVHAIKVKEILNPLLIASIFIDTSVRLIQLNYPTNQFLLQEEQKIKKKKKSTKKKPMAVEEPHKLSQDSSSPEPTPDSETNLADHEYSTGTGKTAGSSQPMAPGVFLSQRRPSSSSSSQNTSSVPPAKVERGNSTDAKGDFGQNTNRIFCDEY